MVHDFGRDERAVGDDDGHFVARDDVRRAEADVLDGPEGASDADEIAVAHGLLEEEDQAADEVLGDVLQTEADADGDHRRSRKQGIEPEAHRVEGADEPDRRHRVANDLRDRELNTVRRSARAQESPRREAEQVADSERDDDDRRAHKERAGRDGRARQLEQSAIEELFEVLGHGRSASAPAGEWPLPDARRVANPEAPVDMARDAHFDASRDSPWAI